MDTETSISERLARAADPVFDWLLRLPTDEWALVVPLSLAVMALAAGWFLYRRRSPRVPARAKYKAGDPEGQIQALIDANQYEEAGDRRVEQADWERALSLFLHAGSHAKAARCYLELKQPAKAADLYRRTGRHAEAAHYFQISECFKDAADSLFLLDCHQEAAELYERARHYDRAAEIHEELGDHESAARLWARCGQHAKSAAALLEARGRGKGVFRRAAELFETGGELERAAECWAEAGELNHAGELLDRAGAPRRAAELYVRAEAWAQAAVCYEKAGELALARSSFQRAGDKIRAAELAGEQGDHLEAAQGFYTVGAYERAVETLQRVGEDSADAHASGRLLARIFIEKGLLDRARAKLAWIDEHFGHVKGDLEVLMLLATALENAGDTVGALDALEHIADLDEDYGDVAERVERLQERAWGQSLTSPGGMESDRYELRNEIGRGGMGIVHLANDAELGRPVAIKFLPQDLASNPSAVKMFRGEARAAAAMNHPNIVHIYDVTVIGGQPCIVMEYVQGRTVRDVMKLPGTNRKQPLPPLRVAEITREMCLALAYAHTQSVVHRDVKPGNMLIAADGHAKLMDFGISKVLETGADGLTAAKGTPQYMPPEQILGREIDGRTDLYALGISMFEMSTGLRPFRGEDVVDQQLHNEMPDARGVNPEVPDGLIAIIRKACQKRPQERYGSAHQMGQALEAFIVRYSEELAK